MVSMAQSRSILQRHKKAYDEKLGTVLINDFFQLSHILESLKEDDVMTQHFLHRSGR